MYGGGASMLEVNLLGTSRELVNIFYLDFVGNKGICSIGSI